MKAQYFFFLPLSYHRYSLRILVQSFLPNDKSTCTLAEPGIEPLTFWLRNNLFFWGVCSCSTVITVGAHTLSPLQIFTQTNICQKNHSHHQKKKKKEKKKPQFESVDDVRMVCPASDLATSRAQASGSLPEALTHTAAEQTWAALRVKKNTPTDNGSKKKRKEKERRARPPLWKHRDVWLVSWIIHFMDKCFICHFSKVTPKSSNSGLCIQQDNRHQSSSICRLMNVSPKLFKITWDFRAGNRRKVGTIFKQSTWTCHLLIFVLTFEANRQEKNMSTLVTDSEKVGGHRWEHHGVKSPFHFSCPSTMENRSAGQSVETDLDQRQDCQTNVLQVYQDSKGKTRKF